MNDSFLLASWFRWCCGLLLLLALRTGELSAAESKRPNIIIILADDLGYSDLGCYGGEINTPHINKLAKAGARFTQFYNSTRCCPSRASLMTGLYPAQTGIGDFTTGRPDLKRGPGYLGRLNDQCVTLAEALGPAGYGCYYVGKWHLHQETGPIKRGFHEFYGYTRDHSHDQYDANYYERLPKGRTPEIKVEPQQYYATDVFNQYALEFIRQGQAKQQPWLLFLGHSSPHFPIQAPAERADSYDAIYRRGWDVLRSERFARMRELGLIRDESWKLTPRSVVPVDRADIANNMPGEQNPAWDKLSQDQQLDLSRRMAVFAAMVQGVDQGVGQIVKHLEQTNDLQSTLILFLSDNGACYEWGPLGFDGESRQGTTTLHRGDELRKIGGPQTHLSYGSAWANLGNTPFRMYKHFTHEGGICTPCIAHWPAGIGQPDRWIDQPAHVMDIMPTLLAATGAKYPATMNNQPVTPLEGVNLLEVMRGAKLPERILGFDHQGAKALRQGDWKVVWSKRQATPLQWELYNLAQDRCETTDLATKFPDRLKQLTDEWTRWAKRVQVLYDGPPLPDAGKANLKSPAVPNAAPAPAKTTANLSSIKPNVVIVFVDDFGWGDPSCYGNKIVQTPRLDQMANQGIRFTQGYVAAPICSPSRCGLITGQCPARWNITSYLQTKAGNRACEMVDFLDPAAPSLPRVMHSAGYATVHIGKWHLGGGRDVMNAPLFRAYGYDLGLGTYESPEPAAALGLKTVPWGKQTEREPQQVARWDRTRWMVDQTLDFIKQHPQQPCFVNLWLDDTHTPFVPSPEQLQQVQQAGDAPNLAKYKAVLRETDVQIGRLLDGLQASNTLVLLIGDNGASPPFERDRLAGLRGQKLSLYEGGIRVPFIVWWPELVRAGLSKGGLVNQQTVISTLDLLPSLAQLVGATLPPGYASDGEQLLAALQGEQPLRRGPLYWEYGRNEQSFVYPADAKHRSPKLAVRDGKWKLLVNADGTAAELYDLATDPQETKDLVQTQSEVTQRLQQSLLKWRASMPSLKAIQPVGSQ